jgi:IS5 family transposase
VNSGCLEKKLLLGENLEGILADVTESTVERSKHKQKRWYSGKKKRHTIKAQIVICAKTKRVIAIFTACGKTHDFNMWKKTIGVKVAKHIKIQADSGYQGIKGLHENSETPKKKTKKQPLTKEEKANNRRIGSERVVIEHVNRWLKRLRIIAERYRNRRKRFGLRVSLFCGIHNFEIVNR